METERRLDALPTNRAALGEPPANVAATKVYPDPLFQALEGDG